MRSKKEYADEVQVVSENTTAGVPAFLAKLWRLVDDPETNHLIAWNTDGKSFVIQNQAQFAKELLPLNYKHNNMASFIRQLNMYGFHKITSLDNGGLKFDRDDMEFTHACFQRGKPYLLELIKRKIAHSKAEEKTVAATALVKPETLNRVLNEVKIMRGKQESLDNRFSSMKQENEALWREVVVLRQKHMKQQQIVNKLIQFLVTMVQPTHRGGLGNLGVKRRLPLMIDDATQSAKVRKPSAEIGAFRPIIRQLDDDEDDIEADLMDDLDYDAVVVKRTDPPSVRGVISEIPNTPVPTSSQTAVDDVIESEQAVNQMIQELKDDLQPVQQSSSTGQLTNQSQVVEAGEGQYEGVDDANFDPNEFLKFDSIIEGKQQDREGASSQSGGTDKAKGNWYSKKEDFISNEMPSNLFEEESSNQQVVESTGIGGVSLPEQSGGTSGNWMAEAGGSSGPAVANGKHMQLARLNSNKLPDDDILTFSSPEEFNSHLETVQNDLNQLKDLFRSDSYSLDSNALLGNAMRTPSIGGLMATATQAEADGGSNMPRSPSVDNDFITKLFNDPDIMGESGIPNDGYHLSMDGNSPNMGGNGSKQMLVYNPPLDLCELLDVDDETGHSSPFAVNEDEEGHDDLRSSSNSSNSAGELHTPLPK